MLPDVGGAVTEVSGGNWSQVSDVYACVRLLADTISTLPLEAYRDTPTGPVEVGFDSRISRLLERPSPGSTVCDLLGLIVTSLQVDGNCFLAKYRGEDGGVVQLGVFDPNQVTVRRVGQVIEYTIGSIGGVITTGPQDILHIRSSVSLDHLRGISPVTQCKMAMSLNASLQASAKTFYEQGSHPSGILSVPSPQGDFTIEKIKEGWNASHAGALNMHRVAVLTGDCNFIPLGLSAEDSQFIQSRELSTREIARIFRVPSAMINGDTGRSMTYSTQEMEAQFFVTHSLRPWLVRIERAISQDPDLCVGNTYVRFDTDALLRASAKERAEINAIALDPVKGWATRDEIRAQEGFPQEAPDGDDA